MIEIPQLILQWIECSKNLSIIEILCVKIGRHIMKNCGEKKDLESKGKFDETSFSLDVKKLQSNHWSCVVLD